MVKTARPLLGGHVSAAGGFDKALERGEAIGAEAIQVFVSSPRAWAVPMPSSEGLKKYAEKRKDSFVKEVYVHGSYLVNLGTSKEDLFLKSRQSLLDEFKVANRIKARAFIFHVGSRNGSDDWLSQVVRVLKEVLKKTPGSTYLALENAAGGGEKIGNFPEELKEIMQRVGSARLRVCLDTAHAFESGLIEDYSSPAALKKSLKHIDRVIGFKNIVALHVNDSKTKAHSHHDRHENIGQGYIGLEGFKNLAKEKSLWHADWLLEVPGFKNEGPDEKNIRLIQSCF